MNDESVNEYVDLLQEEEDILLRAEERPPQPTPPFVVLRMTQQLREQIDLRALQIVGADVTRIIESHTGAWYWLLIDQTHMSPVEKEKFLISNGEGQIANAHPNLWAMAKPLTELWKPIKQA